MPHSTAFSFSRVALLRTTRSSAQHIRIRARIPIVVARVVVHVVVTVPSAATPARLDPLSSLYSIPPEYLELNAPSSPCSYAFVEFRSQRDAEDAYYDMYVAPFSSRFFDLISPHNRHGRYFEGSRLSIQVSTCAVASLVPDNLSVIRG